MFFGTELDDTRRSHRNAVARHLDASQRVASGRFGKVVDDHRPPIQAPELLRGVRLRSRR